MKLQCAWCGKTIKRSPSKVKKCNFCSRQCLGKYSSRSANPDGYKKLKSYDGISQNMRRINRLLNPHRMGFSTRIKLRKARLGKGEGKTYTKYFGRHTHRMVAEDQILGRALKPGEVVHHIDGNKRNNSAKNLIIFPSQAAHAAWHKEREVMSK